MGIWRHYFVLRSADPVGNVVLLSLSHSPGFQLNANRYSAHSPLLLILCFPRLTHDLYIASADINMAGPQEPPVVTATIPYIGHVIGLMRSKFNYYVQLR